MDEAQRAWLKDRIAEADEAYEQSLRAAGIQPGRTAWRPAEPLDPGERFQEGDAQNLDAWWAQKAQEVGVTRQRGPAPATPDLEYWEKWRRWAEAIVDRKIKAFIEPYSEELGKAMGEFANEDRAAAKAADAALAERIGALENTVTELMSALERKVEDLERRAVLKPTRPKLVGGPPDAAD